MDWTQAQIDELRALWAAGHSMAAIGVKMGCSKNAIAGKRNRLGLVERASPINPAARSEQALERRREKLVIAQRMHAEGYSTRQIGAAVGSRPETIALMLRQVGLPGNGRRPKPRAPVEPVVAPAPIAAHPLMRAGATGCRWPIGSPRAAGFRFCDAGDVVPGRPYCLEHCQIAYVQPAVSAAALRPRGCYA